MKPLVPNSDYLYAIYEVCVLDEEGNKIPVAYPPRYDDVEAAWRHILTGREQPGRLPPFVPQDQAK